jgi:hypothetical protein
MSMLLKSDFSLGHLKQPAVQFQPSHNIDFVLGAGFSGNLKSPPFLILQSKSSLLNGIATHFSLHFNVTSVHYTTSCTSFVFSMSLICSAKTFLRNPVSGANKLVMTVASNVELIQQFIQGSQCTIIMFLCQCLVH